MGVVIREAKGTLSAERLETAERSLGIQLPEPYRRFLLAHNGGSPEPSVFHYKNERGAYTDSCVDWFLAIYDGEYSNFEWYFDCYKVGQVRLPAELVPIAHDPGGNLVCIAVDGPNYGAVYFWDHEEEEEEEESPTYNNVHLVADSFEEFLGSLSDLP